MTPRTKGLVIALLHVAMVASLGAKLLYDRATLPRAWVRTGPVDPELPIRGRYVSLRLIVETTAKAELPPTPGFEPPLAVTLRVANDRLIADVKPIERGYNPYDLRLRFVQRGEQRTAMLEPPVAYFIPEHVKDPSIRGAGEELWVEVTVPKQAPPRPIRLAVKKSDGAITPLEFN